MDYGLRIPVAPDYFITKDGEITSTKYKEAKKIKASPDAKGYMVVALRSKGKYLTTRVHRLVALTYLPNPTSLSEVNHKNAIKSDNRVENLEWCDHTHNIRHAFANGLVSRKKGKDSHMHGGKNKDARLVLNLETGIFYDTVKFAAEAYGIPYSTLKSRLNGYRENNTHLTVV